MNLNHKYLLLLCCFFIFSCSTTQGTKQEVLKSSLNVSKDEILTDISNLKKSKDYLLQSGDLLNVSVFMEEKLDKVVRINTNGTITFPLVGNIKISDLSIYDAEQLLSNKLKKYIKNPQVSILVKEYTNNTVYVLGQVKKPSSLQIPPEKTLTVLEAITSAGGFTDVANISKVRVLRMVNGIQESFDVDVSQITKQGKKELDISLISGDVVFVPQSIF